jgi:rhamnosyltransferase
MKKSSTKTAILLATFNGEPNLESQIVSLLNQTNVSVDIYVRDDGSTDGTLKIINKFSKLKQVVNITDYTQSGSPAANFFKILSHLVLSDYDYIAFSDQDDIWFPEKLNSAIDTIVFNEADCYSSNLIAFDNTKFSSWTLNKYSYIKQYDYLFQGASAGCTYVINTTAASLVLKKLGSLSNCYPKGRSHDWLIYAICRSHGLKWVHDDRTFIAYRQHGGNAFGAMPGARGLLQRLSLSKNGWYRNQILWHRQFLAQQPEETRILNAIARLNVMDRFYLVSKAWDLRRSGRDCILISFLIMLGLL